MDEEKVNYKDVFSNTLVIIEKLRFMYTEDSVSFRQRKDSDNRANDHIVTPPNSFILREPISIKYLDKDSYYWRNKIVTRQPMVSHLCERLIDERNTFYFVNAFEYTYLPSQNRWMKYPLPDLDDDDYYFDY